MIPWRGSVVIQAGEQRRVVDAQSHRPFVRPGRGIGRPWSVPEKWGAEPDRYRVPLRPRLGMLSEAAVEPIVVHHEVVHFPEYPRVLPD
jgi:hypothetical protein